MCWNRCAPSSPSSTPAHEVLLRSRDVELCADSGDTSGGAESRHRGLGEVRSRRPRRARSPSARRSASVSRRAASSAWIVGGTCTSASGRGRRATSPSARSSTPSSMSIRSELLDEERVALGRRRRSGRGRSVASRPAAEQRLDHRPARRSRRGARQLDPGRAFARRPTRRVRRRSSGLVGQTSSRGAVVDRLAARCSTSSRRVGSAQWMSSITSDHRTLGRQMLEEPPHGPEELLDRRTARAPEADHRGEPLGDALPGRVGERASFAEGARPRRRRRRSRRRRGSPRRAART